MDTSKEALMRQHVLGRLMASGQKDELKELLRSKLEECGWRKKVTDKCKDIFLEKLREAGHMDKVSVDDVTEELTRYGRSCIPDNVKKDLLDEIKDVLQGLSK